MPSGSHRTSGKYRASLHAPHDPGGKPGPWLVLGFLIILTFLPASPFALQTGIILLGLGLLPWICPPTAAIPKAWILLTVLTPLLGFSSFLPAGWFPFPAWRTNLEAVALPKTPTVVIQWRQALEHHAVFICVIMGALTLTGRRTSASQTKNLALAFVMASAVWTVIAMILQARLTHINMGTFGFFPNRNHTGTLLAIASTCGIGVLMQAMKDRQWARFTIAGTAEAILVAAIFTMSISRAGLLLCTIGLLIWFVILGLRYWSSNQLRVIGLILLLVTGIFFITETRVKSRIADTIGKTGSSQTTGSSGNASFNELDFRIPIARDTLSMIADAPLTGIGAGQFRYVFPQYRHHSILRQEKEALHPESDWLWLAAEYGIPATCVLLSLIIWIFGSVWISVRNGRDRALRGACFAAATLVPLHGIIDVPGHRPVLLLVSAFLLMLAFDPNPASSGSRGQIRLFRISSILVLALAVRFLGIGWFGFPLPYSERGMEFVRNHSERSKSITPPNTPITLSDLQRRRLELKHDTTYVIALCPLERRLYTLAGITTLPIQSESAFAGKAFEMDLLLEPSLVQIPLYQAKEWIAIDPQRTIGLWAESLARSKKIDDIANDNRASSSTRASIRKVAVRNRDLRRQAEELLQDPQPAGGHLPSNTDALSQ